MSDALPLSFRTESVSHSLKTPAHLMGMANGEHAPTDARNGYSHERSSFRAYRGPGSISAPAPWWPKRSSNIAAKQAYRWYPIPKQEAKPRGVKISIVTAVRNRADTIGDTLASVQAQDYPHVEHLIQDGASSDVTLEVIERMRQETTQVVSEPDTGIYDAINRGIARATGDVIGLIHSDDVFSSPQILSKVAKMFEDPSVQGVYGDLDYVSARDMGKIVRRWRSGAYHPQRLTEGWMPPHPTLYLRREVFDTWGGYDTSMRIAADYEAILRYLLKGQIKLAYLPVVMVKMRMGGESNRSLSRLLRKSREDLTAMRRHGVGGWGTLFRKNISKLEQFMKKKLEIESKLPSPSSL